MLTLSETITRERLRQLRLKMRRQATQINKLEAELDRIYQILEQLREEGKKGDGTSTECHLVYSLDDLLTELKKKYYSVY